MRKGPILLTIGIVLAVLSVPMLLGYTLFDERTISMYDFDDEGSTDTEWIQSYTFENISPGTIIVRSRDIFMDIDSFEVEIIYLGDGSVVEEYDMIPGSFFWNEEETKLKKTGDYEIRIITDESVDAFMEFQVKYSANYSRLGLISALFGFPIFLIAGIAGISWGSVTIYKKKRGLDEPSEVNSHYKYEGEDPLEDEKKAEWDEYETSPRRKEIWFEPMTNPYDDMPSDYYSRKRAEGEAFSKRWHQRLGDELEYKMKKKIEKKKKPEKIKVDKDN